jgi:outer membrane protein assembly factor BamB
MGLARHKPRGVSGFPPPRTVIGVPSQAYGQGRKAQDWPAYRHDAQRTGVQPTGSALSDPAKVKTLSVKWGSQIPGTPTVHPVFRASPIIVGDTVFIGSKGGYFYALDAAWCAQMAMAKAR